MFPLLITLALPVTPLPVKNSNIIPKMADATRAARLKVVETQLSALKTALAGC